MAVSNNIKVTVKKFLDIFLIGSKSILLIAEEFKSLLVEEGVDTGLTVERVERIFSYEPVGLKDLSPGDSCVVFDLDPVSNGGLSSASLFKRRQSCVEAINKRCLLSGKTCLISASKMSKFSLVPEDVRTVLEKSSGVKLVLSNRHSINISLDLGIGPSRVRPLLNLSVERGKLSGLIHTGKRQNLGIDEVIGEPGAHNDHVAEENLVILGSLQGSEFVGDVLSAINIKSVLGSGDVVQQNGNFGVVIVFSQLHGIVEVCLGDFACISDDLLENGIDGGLLSCECGKIVGQCPLTRLPSSLGASVMSRLDGANSGSRATGHGLQHGHNLLNCNWVESRNLCFKVVCSGGHISRNGSDESVEQGLEMYVLAVKKVRGQDVGKLHGSCNFTGVSGISGIVRELVRNNWRI